MSRLEDLEAFIHIAEVGSLTKAARRLNRTLQAVTDPWRRWKRTSAFSSSTARRGIRR